MTHYWPITNGLVDEIGTANLIANGTDVNLAPNRFNVANSSVLVRNSGFLSMIADAEMFNGSFSFLVWVKSIKTNLWPRIFDCGNGKDADNIVILFSYYSTNRPGVRLFRGSSYTEFVVSPTPANLNEWFHLGLIFFNLQKYFFSPTN